jgi:high-affinity nickel-transport protein
MMPLLSIICVGFFLGMRHATDPDHVIAVTTIVSRERSPWKAALVGVVWGIGHTATLMVVGGAIILFGLVIPPKLGMSMEFCVALMLVFLGVWNLKSFNRWLIPLFHSGVGGHSHPHQHGDYVHAHPHGHGAEDHGHNEDQTAQARLDSRFEKWHIYRSLRPLLVGIVHGLAGSAAVALMVLPMIRNPYYAVGYLVVFGVGTIAGMMVITAAIALPFSYTAHQPGPLHRRLCLASGFLSLGFGAFMIYEIGCVQGLFLK